MMVPTEADAREDQVDQPEVVVRDELPDEPDEDGGREQRHVQGELEELAARAVPVEQEREDDRQREDEQDRLDGVDRRVLDRPGQLAVARDVPPVLEADELRRVQEPALVEAEPDRPEHRHDEEREEGDEVRQDEGVGPEAAPLAVA